MIYRDFNHWFSTSEAHGFSSASREYAQAIWDDLRPTMEASLDDYKRAYLELSNERARGRSELVDKLFKYIEEYRQSEQPTFWKWLVDRSMGKGDENV